VLRGNREKGPLTKSLGDEKLTFGGGKKGERGEQTGISQKGAGPSLSAEGTGSSWKGVDKTYKKKKKKEKNIRGKKRWVRNSIGGGGGSFRKKCVSEKERTRGRDRIRQKRDLPSTVGALEVPLPQEGKGFGSPPGDPKGGIQRRRK